MVPTPLNPPHIAMAISNCCARAVITQIRRLVAQHFNNGVLREADYKIVLLKNLGIEKVVSLFFNMIQRFST
jgi:hypothetical protein